MRVTPVLLLAADVGLASAPALASGYKGHEIPAIRAKVDAILANDTDCLIAPYMTARSTWAKARRSARLRETAAWHFVDAELDAPELNPTCSR